MAAARPGARWTVLTENDDLYRIFFNSFKHQGCSDEEAEIAAEDS